MHSRTTILVGAALLAMIAGSVWAGSPVEFANSKLIEINTPRIPDDDGFVTPLVATPYPSTIKVSGFAASETIEKITVTLHDLSHGEFDDIDILLVGPEGQNVILFSDAGGSNVGGGAGEFAVTVTLDDDAVEPLPDQGEIVSGTYLPSNYELDDDEYVDIFPDEDEDGLPTPHPEPDIDSTLSVFSGTFPNGEWRLYVVDDEVFESGEIAGGWSLSITAGVPAPLQPFRRSDANGDSTLDITDAVVTLGALFLGVSLECADAADADDDGQLNLTDVIFTLDFMFLSGPLPPAPGREVCGVDPTPDGLPCDSFTNCP